MLSQLRFQDHEGFQRAALYWTVGGAGGAMLALFGRSLLGLGEGSVALTMLGGIGLGIGAAVGALDEKLGRVALGAALGLGLGVVMALVSGLGFLGGAGPLVGAALGGEWAGLCWGSSSAPAPARATGTAIGAVVGMFVAMSFVLGPKALSFMQLPGVQDAAAGALLGFFASLGGAVGRLRVGAKDPVMQVWEEARGQLKGDMAELGEQAIKLYEEVQARIARRRAESKDGAALTEAERVAGETATGLIKLAERWCQIEEGADKTARPRLEARLEALEAKIKASGDAVIKAEYSAAAAVVRDQLQGFEKIDVARERLVARMHRSLASLERVSLKLLQLSTSDAQDASLGLRPELERLDEMSDDLSWKTLSVDELCNMTADGLPSEAAPALAVPAPAAPALAEAEVKEVVEEQQTA